MVGIVANPAAGQDIRRLVAHAAAVDSQGKVSIIRRVLVGLEALGVDCVLLMPDTHGLARRAVAGADRHARVARVSEIIDLPVTGQPADSETAARMMREAGAGCIVVLGGDGTVRAVSHGSGDVPILPLSTGTNNVVPSFVDGTIAGLAAAAIARGDLPTDAGTYRHKRLVLRIAGREVADALVDAAVLRGRFVGSRAVWDVVRLRQAVVTRATPTSIGVSALVGAVKPVSPVEPFGVALAFSAGAPHRVMAAVAPGIVAEVGLADWRRLGIGEGAAVAEERPLVVALDGEREVALDRAEPAQIVLRADGPCIVDVERVMTMLAAEGYFYSQSGADAPARSGGT